MVGSGIIKRFIVIIIVVLVLVGGYFYYKINFLDKSLENNLQNEKGNENGYNYSGSNSQIKDGQEVFYSYVDNAYDNALMYYLFNNRFPANIDYCSSKNFKCESQSIDNDGYLYLSNCNINGNLYSYDGKQGNQAKYMFVKFVDDDAYGAITGHETTGESPVEIISLYMCKSNECEVIILGSKAIIADYDVYYMELSGEDHSLHKMNYIKNYVIDSIFKEDIYITIYEVDGIKIYRSILHLCDDAFSKISVENNGNIGGMAYSYGAGGSTTVLFNEETLKNGLVLYSHFSYSSHHKSSYIYDFKGNQKVYDISENINFNSFYKENDNYYIIDNTYDENVKLDITDIVKQYFYY